MKAVEGPHVSETRTVTGFTNLRLEGAANIEWQRGSPVSVVVEGPRDAVANTTTEVRDGTLVIAQGPHFNVRGELTVKVQAPTADRFELLGAGNLNASGLDSDKISVQLRGAGNATLKGKARRVELDVAGAGNVNARELITASASVGVAGVGNVQVFASEDLSAAVSGVGEVRYYGHPKNVSKSASGVGTVSEQD